MVSAHNPFRTPAVTPNPTGLSSTSFPNIASSLSNIHNGVERAHSTSPSPPPEDLPSLSGPGPTPTPAPTSSRPESEEDILLEELPPAYTPAPDVGHGEATIEVGPRRPFLPAQQPPHQVPHFMSPAPTGWQAPQFSGAASWSSYPGQMHPQPTGASYLAPPPLHPVSSMRRTPERPSSAPAPNDAPLSDFARDFYTAGRDQRTSETNASAEQYNPPPGEPPRSPAASSSRDGNEPPDDGRPTQRPTPGHPLMRNGKCWYILQDTNVPNVRESLVVDVAMELMIYAPGHNMGFKYNDPTHPCSKCWEKFAKAFSGAIAYAPWSSSASTESGGARVTLQRPLPRFTPPQQTAGKHRQTQSYGAPPVRPPLHPPNGYSSSSYSHVVPSPGGGVPMGPYLDPLQRSPYAPPPVMPSHAPPPGAAVVRPGDPRIGGRLCWRCGGTGTTTFLIFDEMTCNVCNGLGRTFV
ncbi:hypothetical protein B0H21DRAFT_874625 [Amylocystis lapponica]|nr:hypothetical protein B0H21DRAFT_874625 [Amylocystis lapponica]